MITINELIKIRLKVTFWHSSCPDLRPLQDDSVILVLVLYSRYIYITSMCLENDLKIVKLPDN